MDWTIEGKLFLNGILENCCIGIEDGKISKISKIIKSENHKNFGNKLILPAGIDLHVHFREPGFTNKEDFSSGSKSAAFGGVTCIFDMPNTMPQTTTEERLIEKRRIAEKKSYLDFGLYSAITNYNFKNISDLKKYSSGFKLYLGESTNSINFDKNNLEYLKNINFSGKTILVHAEDQGCIDYYKIKEKNIFDHIKSHPNECEKKAINEILSIFKGSNIKIHICHISSSNSISEIKKYKNITCGVTPNHLLLDIESIDRNQSFYKVNPPIREKFERERLFKNLKNENVDVIESDHAPHTYEEKNIDFDTAPSGIPGVETMIPVFLFLLKKDIISISQFVRLFSEKPAEILDIPKGRIEVGRDADFIVVDLKNICKINSDKLHYKCGWSPFNDYNAIFPKHVILRGEYIIKGGEMNSYKGYGNFIGGN